MGAFDERALLFSKRILYQACGAALIFARLLLRLTLWILEVSTSLTAVLQA